MGEANVGDANVGEGEQPVAPSGTERVSVERDLLDERLELSRTRTLSLRVIRVDWLLRWLVALDQPSAGPPLSGDLGKPARPMTLLRWKRTKTWFWTSALTRRCDHCQRHLAGRALTIANQA